VRTSGAEETVLLKNDFKGKAVLVTGGTKGLGLAIGLCFGEQGAEVYLTHKWGSADEAAVRRTFAERGAPVPHIVEADAANDDDTKRLLATIRERHESIFVFVSNVSFAQIGKGMEGLTKRALFQSLEYSAWPMMGYAQRIKQIFGRYPRYTLGTSCDGPDTYYPNYEYVAVSKVVVETFCRYMAKHLFEAERSTVNIIRSRPVSTESLAATFGAEFEPFLREHWGDDYLVDVEQVGSAALALCSGLMDAMNGQVILLDRGVSFQDNLMRMFQHRDELPQR
jgi:enoyl-[acyl-carrier-protein] reductase (NADH)